jgi:hypothetical protein
MKASLLLVGVLAVVTATGASAQSLNLTGAYKCVQMCRGDLLAYVTQNGPEINLTTEAGQPSRAWPDWFAPATRIWAESLAQGAVYSPDGILIQFDGGTIWQRYIPPPPPPIIHRRRSY